MKILAIGNSFSQDAMTYVHNIAKSENFSMTTVNLCIGGCPLSRHYKNMLTDAKDYSMEFNGMHTGFMVSIKEALLSNDWDVVTLQQASGKCFDYETYQPYLNALADYVRKYSPKSKILIHQTWAYEQGSKLLESVGYSERKNMFKDIKASYEAAVKDIKADGIIPSGQLFENLIAAGISDMHRDTFHASFGVGRYALGLLWYSMLSGNDIADNCFCDFDEPITEKEITIVKKFVSDTLNSFR